MTLSGPETQDVLALDLPQNGCVLPEGVFVDGFVGSKVKIENPIFEKSNVSIGDVFHIHTSDAIDAKDIIQRQNIKGKVVISGNGKSQKYTMYSLVVIFGVLMIAGVTLGVVALLVSKESPEESPEYEDVLDSNSTLRIVTRSEWSALRPKVVPTKLAVDPPKMVIIAHTAGIPCNKTILCCVYVRNIQSYHLTIYNDIGSNFLIGGDGVAYTGRGWGIEGAHTKRYNNRSIGISFIGNFMLEPPPKRQLHAALALIEFGVKHGKIDSDYVLYGHKQLIATDSPGAALMPLIEKWPHWEPRN